MAFPRFLFAGAVNTGLTYLIYLGLLLFIPYVWAYSIAYIIGIGLGYTLNALWVFNRPLSLRTFSLYPLVYLLNYLLGVIFLWVLVEMAKLPKEIAPLFVVALSVPIMYFATRTIIRGKISNEKANNQ